jgi:hypothetical protein
MPDLPSIRVPGGRPVLGSTTRWRRQREDLYVHNASRETTHEVRITVVKRGRTCHEKTYRLRPGQTGCSFHLVPAGRYVVTATVDGGQTATGEVRIGDTPDRTIVVELCDGSVTVGEGHG